jgi:hypothetical protein
MTDLLSTQEVADLAGIAAPSVSSKMRRGGVTPAARAPGRGGSSMWEAQRVAAVLAAARGRWPKKVNDYR